MNFPPLARDDSNVLADPENNVEVCSLGQIAAYLTNVVGMVRPMV